MAYASNRRTSVRLRKREIRRLIAVIASRALKADVRIGDRDAWRTVEDARQWGNSAFRTDIGAFLSDADIEACVDADRPTELPPRPGANYFAFADPSGGRGDHYVCAIGHRDKDRFVVDVLRGARPPFDPKAVTAEFSTLLSEYRCTSVTGDNYSAAWVEQEFKANSIRYLRSELPKNRLYVEGLPWFTRRVVSLPNHPHLVRELKLLERHTHASGRDTVDHPRHGNDDYANAVFGLLHIAQKPKASVWVGVFGYGSGPITLIDVATGRPIERQRSHLVRVGKDLHIVGGDNSCWTTEELKRRGGR